LIYREDHSISLENNLEIIGNVFMEKPSSFMTLRFTILLALLISGMSYLFPSNGLAAPVTLTIGTVAPPDSPWSALLTQFKNEVEKKTEGKIKIKLMLGGVLGDENEMVIKCTRGQVQAVGVSTGAIATKVPEVNVIELPFLFQNAEEADRVIDQVLTPKLEKHFLDRGLVLGFWSENGYRMFASRDRKIQAPSDLKGLKMRSQESPVHLSMYRTYGSSAVPIPTTEVLQALANGNVDGYDQTILYAIAAGWHKSVKHFTLSEHIYQPAAIVYNKKWFDGLPKEMQTLLMEQGRALQNKGRKAVRAIQGELIEILKYEKIETHKLSASQRKVFEEASLPVYAQFKKDTGKVGVALLEATQAELKKIRDGK
jgi:tripartite ATP-independent transporter DctP family solute receptor